MREITRTTVVSVFHTKVELKLNSSINNVYLANCRTTRTTFKGLQKIAVAIQMSRRRKDVMKNVYI